MSENTLIEWADHTFNPWEGCTKVGPGCDHCYAETRNARFGGGQAGNWGPGAPRRRTSAANWRKPLAWNRQRFMQCSACGWRGALAAELIGCGSCKSTDHLGDVRQRVFCASLADVFDNEVDPAWRAELFGLIAATPHLDWLLLTKRIGKVRAMLADMQLSEPPTNVWLGATVGNQTEANRDIPKLLDVPARVRFLSVEPMLGPIDLQQSCTIHCPNGGTCFRLPDSLNARCVVDSTEGGITVECICSRLNGLHWLICGGESGPHARPMHPIWARSLRDQCHAAGVPFLFKQWGEWLPISDQDEELNRSLYRSNRVAKPSEDQAALDDSYGRTCTVLAACIQGDGLVLDASAPMAFRQGTQPMLTLKIGKKAAGRLLEGREHNGYPRIEMAAPANHATPRPNRNAWPISEDQG